MTSDDIRRLADKVGIIPGAKSILNQVADDLDNLALQLKDAKLQISSLSKANSDWGTLVTTLRKLVSDAQASARTLEDAKLYLESTLQDAKRQLVDKEQQIADLIKTIQDLQSKVGAVQWFFVMLKNLFGGKDG